MTILNYLIPAAMVAAFVLPILPIINALWIMNYETLEEIVCGRIEDLVDQMAFHQSAGNDVMLAVLHDEIKQLTSHMKDDEYDFFYATDCKHLDKWTTSQLHVNLGTLIQKAT